MANGEDQRRVIRIAGFNAGVLSKKLVGRVYPIEALRNGLNLDLTSRSIRTRRGYDKLTSSPIAAGSIQRLFQAGFPTPAVTRLLAQLDTGSANKLYASKTNLPSTALAFSEIYDMTAGADIVDIAQLNDRVIMTEKVNNAPLVWGGVMETDGSDWMVPKAVLITWDGVNFHNITDELCDPDSDTVADIGSMTSSSYIYFCLDVPILNDLYVEVATANTTATEDEDETIDIDYGAEGEVVGEGLQGSIDHWVQDSGATGHFEDSGNNPLTLGSGGLLYANCDFSSSSHITIQDLRSDITNWVQDSGATGHFTDGADAQTLGPGNDAPDVEVGCRVIINGTDYYIKAITDDGEGTGEVELNSSVASNTCTGIYGIEVSDSNIQATSITLPEPDGSLNTSTTNLMGSQTSNSSPYTISGTTAHSSTVEKWKAFDGTTATYYLTLDEYLTYAYLYVYFGSNKKCINKMRCMGHAYGAYEWWPTYVTIKGSQNGSTWTTLKTNIYCTNGTDWSSWFTWTNATEYAYYMFRIDAYHTEYDGKYRIREIQYVEAGEYKQAPTIIHVGHSTDTVQIDSSTWTQMRAVSVNQTTPGSSEIYHAVSFDARSTWQVYKSSAWVDIVKQDGVWKYWDGGSWQTASIDSMIQALREALNDSDNQMTQSEVEAMTNTDWEKSGGFIPGTTTTIDFAWALKSYDNSAADDDIPTLDKYIVAYRLAAENDCPYVEEGCIVRFEDTELNIVAITDEGEGSGEVELTAAHLDGTVLKISGVQYDSGNASIAYTGTSVPTISHVCYDNGNLQVDTTTWKSMNSVAVTCTKPGSSGINFSVSFDSRTTWQVYSEDTWVSVVREDSGNWQYWSGTAWINAEEDNMLTALRQGLNIASNAWDETTLEAMDSAEWEASGGFVAGTTTTIDFAALLQPDGTNKPIIDKFTITYDDQATVVLEGYNGSWTNIPITTDGTQSGGISLAQDGVIDITASSFTATVWNIEEITGYWYRLSIVTGTSSGTELSSIAFKAPCQPLAKLAPDGVPSIPMSVVFVVASLGAYKDITPDVTDDVEATGQYLNDGAESPTGWTTSDALYIGSSYPFNAVQFTVGINDSSGAVENNQNVAAMTVSYWDGDSYTAVSNQSDGTSASSKTLIQKGVVSWTDQGDSWKQNNPIGGAYPLGYWVKITVNATLTATLSLGEVRVYPVPTALTKYALCGTKLDRLVLGNRTDNAAQVDVSRRIEEYGIQSGEDSFSYTPGSQDSIVAMAQIYNELLFISQRYGYLLTGDSPDDFEVERQDVGEQVPLNSRCLVLAPSSGAEKSLQVSAYYLNHSGVFSIQGFQTRVFTGLQRESLGEISGWWDQDERPYVDKSNLHTACGVYWPDKELLVFSVPMIVDIPLNSGSPVTNKGGGKVGLPCTAHGLSTGTSISVSGMTNYSGTYTVDATSSTNEIVITDTYTAETVTDAGVVYKNAQTSNNRLVCYDLRNKIWHPPRDVAVDSLCVAFDRNTSAPGNIGQRMLLGGTSAGNVLRLFDDMYTDDDGTDISWSAETGWLDFQIPDRKRITRITLWGLTAGDSVTLKLYRDGSNELPTGWEFTFTDVAGLGATQEFDDATTDPFLVAWLYKLKISGDKQADFFIDIEVEPYPGVR